MTGAFAAAFLLLPAVLSAERTTALLSSSRIAFKDAATSPSEKCAFAWGANRTLVVAGVPIGALYGSLGRSFVGAAIRAVLLLMSAEGDAVPRRFAGSRCM